MAIMGQEQNVGMQGSANMNDRPETLPPPPPGSPSSARRRLEALEGETISGRYLILRRIGKGGMGVVYLAQQTNLNRNVCIKVLNPDLLDNEDAVSRFEREAKGLSRLQHPNIVTIFDYGRDNELAYIVMEYAQGITLGKFIKQNGALALDVFLPIAVQTLKGIGEAHKFGLIHRDIKPANIMLCELEGEKNFVKILDFGLAKLAQGQEDVTKEQQLVGSASYMAPEQILLGHSDTRTDVYALGVMFYLMLSGRKPFVGSNDNVILYKHVNEIPSPLASMVQETQAVPAALCEVIDQCLNKDPDKRPQSATDLLNAFSLALDAPQIRAGYSSMSLARIDLQKISEDAETHMMAGAPEMGGLMTMSAVNQALSNGNAPGEISETQSMAKNAPAQQSIQIALNAGDVSGVSSAGSLSGIIINNPSGSGVPQLIVQPLAPSRDRKALIIGVAIVAVVLVGISFAIILNRLSSNTPARVSQVTISDDKLAGLFASIEKSIRTGQYRDAEVFLTSVQNRPDAQTADTMEKVLKYKSLIEQGYHLENADKAMAENRLEEARRIYEAVIRQNPGNERAVNGLKAVNERFANMVTVKFHYTGDWDALECFVDDKAEDIVDAQIIVAPGTHTLRISREGYKDFVHQVRAGAAESLDIDISLEKEKKAVLPKKSQETSDDGGLLLAPSKKKSRGAKNGLIAI